MTTTEDALSANLISRLNIGDMLTRATARTPGALAVVDGERRLTYAELDTAVNRLAHGLSAKGYVRGDALGLMSGNSLEFLLTYFACAKLGLVCVPINLSWRAHEISYVLGHSQVRGMVVEAQLAEPLAAALSDVPALTDVMVAPGTVGTDAVADRGWVTLDSVAHGQSAGPVEAYVEDRDPLQYLYTSGTTSAPKGVVGTHLSAYLGAVSSVTGIGLTQHSRIAALMPLFHVAQLNALTVPTIYAGGLNVILRGFDVSGLLEVIERERITSIFALPVMYAAMVDSPDIEKRDVSSLERAVYAMAPIPKATLVRAMELFGCEFTLGFGQTEFMPMSTMFLPEHQLSHHGAVGTQVLNIQTEIMGPDGTLLPRGESGEIVYRGPQALQGYLRNPEATAAAFAHGWFHSGDLGHMDEDGMLWFEDRYKDVIKTGGENVASLEVERALYEAEPRIKEVAVVGLPHERWVEAITAVVTAKPGETLTEQDVLRAAEGLPGFKRPKRVLVLDDLPRTATGKIQKHLLRKQHLDLYTAGSA